MKKSDLHNGDMLFVFGTDFIGNVVSFACGGPSHVALVIIDPPGEESGYYLVEMIQEGCVLNLVDKYFGHNVIAIGRYRAGITAEQGAAIAAQALSCVGKKKYSNPGAIGMGILNLLSCVNFWGWSPASWFRSTQNNPLVAADTEFCSFNVGEDYWLGAGIDLTPKIKFDSNETPNDIFSSPVVEIIANSRKGEIEA